MRDATFETPGLYDALCAVSTGACMVYRNQMKSSNYIMKNCFQLAWFAAIIMNRSQVHQSSFKVYTHT